MVKRKFLPSIRPDPYQRPFSLNPLKHPGLMNL